LNLECYQFYKLNQNCKICRCRQLVGVRCPFKNKFDRTVGRYVIFSSIFDLFYVTQKSKFLILSVYKRVRLLADHMRHAGRVFETPCVDGRPTKVILKSILPNFFLHTMKIFSVFLLLSMSVCCIIKY